MFTVDDHHTRTGSPRTTGTTAACVVPAEASSVPGVRRFTRSVARHWRLSGGVTEAAEQIVTELAANAVRHSESPDLAVLIGLDERALTIEVRDRGQWRPSSPEAILDTDGGGSAGRGLALVNAYSTGCMLWCEQAGTRAVAKVPVTRCR